MSLIIIISTVLSWIISITRFIPAAIEASTKRSKTVWLLISAIITINSTTSLMFYFRVNNFILNFLLILNIILCLLFMVYSKMKHFQAIGDIEFSSQIRQVIEHGNPSEILRQIKEKL